MENDDLSVYRHYLSIYSSFHDYMTRFGVDLFDFEMTLTLLLHKLISSFCLKAYRPAMFRCYR